MTFTVRAYKGHGTENDFVLLPDLDAMLSVSPTLVRALCDRQSGIGADGVLRVVRTALATEPDVRRQSSVAEYFMDYHNADGSLAEMCGNGARVFAQYLRHAKLVDPREVVTIATRGGVRSVCFVDDQVSVDMGVPLIRPEKPLVGVDGLVGQYRSVAVDMPNPHVVVELDDVVTLQSVDLSRQPNVIPALPEGQNVEFMVRTGPRRLRMRVHERGSGETRSCGTGICAAAVVANSSEDTGASRQNAPAGLTPGPGNESAWVVEVPGGECRVSWSPTGTVVLTGPAELVAALDLSEQWLEAHR